MIRFVPITLLLLVCYSGNAQTDNSLGNWEILILKGNINKKFSFIGEFNIRNDDLISTYNYSEYKLGIGYALTRNFGILLGTGVYNNNHAGSFLTTTSSQKEYRTWFEMSLKQLYKRLYFEHRGRIEQRFTTSGYKNRLRYRLSLTIPITKPNLTEKTLFIASANEIFIGQNSPTYEKNRFYAGIGYKLNDNLSFQIGGLNQVDYKSDDNIRTNYLQLLIICNLGHIKLDKHL